MIYITLRFPDRPTAITLAKSLGYWDDENDQLRTSGQVQRTDGTAYSWGIDEIGQVEDQDGWWANIVGAELPAALAPYVVPYGSGGRVFAGTEPEPV